MDALQNQASQPLVSLTDLARCALENLHNCLHSHEDILSGDTLQIQTSEPLALDVATTSRANQTSLVVLSNTSAKNEESFGLAYSDGLDVAPRPSIPAITTNDSLQTRENCRSATPLTVNSVDSADAYSRRSIAISTNSYQLTITSGKVQEPVKKRRKTPTTADEGWVQKRRKTANTATSNKHTKVVGDITHLLNNGAERQPYGKASRPPVYQQANSHAIVQASTPAKSHPMDIAQLLNPADHNEPGRQTCDKASREDGIVQPLIDHLRLDIDTRRKAVRPTTTAPSSAPPSLIHSLTEQLYGRKGPTEADAASTAIITQQKEAKHPCPRDLCKKVFKRISDLNRHIVGVHSDTIKSNKCDYKRCAQREPFRPDHFRDHLRDDHKEDLFKRGWESGQEMWWRERAAAAVWQGWWRCSKCFMRVQSEEGWQCGQCQSVCESGRQEYRQLPVRCDYEECSEESKEWYAPAGFREHLRTKHKEDLPRSDGEKGAKELDDKDWWNERNPDALLSTTWRCTRCFDAVDGKKYGFVCGRCGFGCEEARRSHHVPVTDIG